MFEQKFKKMGKHYKVKTFRTLQALGIIETILNVRLNRLSVLDLLDQSEIHRMVQSEDVEER